MNRFSDAEEAAFNALKFAKLLDNNFMLMRSWLSIGKLQVLQGKYITAIESLQKCISIATEDFGDKYYLSQAYETLGKAYAGNHNYRDAYQAHAEYDILKNAIFTAEAEQHIMLLQTEFELAEKESTIIDQESRIERQKTSQRLTSIIAGLLLLLLLLLYITFQNNKKKNILLQEQNTEKEFLLKEIHHRVKNNLGIVSSLLELQSSQIEDPNVVEAIQESQNRVYSMSMIHQKLYLGKNLSAIDMKDYFVNLSEHVLDSFGANDHISFGFKLDAIELDIDTAIPLGLIVNELLTNAFKYAFPDSRIGKINIGLQKLENHTILLEVADNGIGRQEEHMNKGTGFGTQLINLLIHQLDGKLSRKDKDGTSVSIEFKLE